MLHREESIIIHRALPEVFKKAQDIVTTLEKSVDYKKVEILDRQGENSSHRSTIRLFGIPVSYTSETVIKQNESINHKQIKGPLRGLKTAWIFDAVGEDTRVAVRHQLDLKIPMIGRWLEWVVYALVIRPLARNFLRGMKQGRGSGVKTFCIQ
ncbi:hypothetical protein HY792_05540, partial [Candidatus Desantisbacteria bacterium]|nr:hypothetical protein [Candidatus Desantisbacteria bacterium]